MLCWFDRHAFGFHSVGTGPQKDKEASISRISRFSSDYPSGLLSHKHLRTYVFTYSFLGALTRYTFGPSLNHALPRWDIGLGFSGDVVVAFPAGLGHSALR